MLAKSSSSGRPPAAFAFCTSRSARGGQDFQFIKGYGELLVIVHGDFLFLNEARLRMARVPQGAELIANPASGAPGFRIGHHYIHAGVPPSAARMRAARRDSWRRR